MSGKGDTPRPFSVDQETYRERFPMARKPVPNGARYIAGRGWVRPCAWRDHPPSYRVHIGCCDGSGLVDLDV